MIPIRAPLDFGLLIRHRRRQLGLKQAEMASRVGVGRQWIVDIENGKARAELGLVLRTLRALDITLAVVEGETELRADDGIAPIDIDAVVERHKQPRA